MLALALAVAAVGSAGKANGDYDALNIVVDDAVGGLLVACGLALRRLPDHARAGLLVYVAGVAWLAENLVTADWQPAYSLGALLAEVSPPAVAHALLAYPSGRLPGRAARAVVATGYACAFVMALLLGMTISWDPACECPRFLLQLDNDGFAVRATLADVHEITTALLSVAAIVLLVRRWRAAGVGERLALGTVLPPALVVLANEVVHDLLRARPVSLDGTVPLGRSLSVLALGAIGACALWGVHRAAAATAPPPAAAATPLPDAEQVADLTKRERIVLGLMAQGCSNQAIAERLVVSRRTVETHVGRIFRKLGLSSSDDGNRRVRAVLAYLDSANATLPDGEPAGGRRAHR